MRMECVIDLLEEERKKSKDLMAFSHETPCAFHLEAMAPQRAFDRRCCVWSTIDLSLARAIYLAKRAKECVEDAQVSAGKRMQKAA